MASWDIVFRPSILTPVLLLVLYSIYKRIQQSSRLPKGLPRSSKDARYKTAESVPEKLKVLQENYSDKGLKYIHDGGGMDDTAVVVPPSDIPWIISQPETILSAQEMHREQLQSDWVFLDDDIVKIPIHQEVIRGNMVRKLDAFTDPVLDELRACFDEYWGSGTEWHEVKIWDSMLKFFARTSNRMFVGLPLCRNEEFLDACRGFAQDVPLSGVLLKFMPGWLKPVLGYLTVAPNWWHYRKAAKYLVPVIEERFEKIKQNPEKDPADLLPNDFISWSIIGSLHSTDPREQTPARLTKRIMTTNFAAIHTTTMTSTNLLLDLLSSNPSLGYLEALTNEVQAINESNGGDWSKAALAAMTRTDSALRESMRYSGFVVWGLQRKVVAKDGVTMPDGTHLPYWSTIEIPAWSIHHNDQVYENPFEYDALRFSRLRETLSGEHQKVHVGEEGLVEGEQGYVESRAHGGSRMNGSTKPEKDLSKVLEGKNLSTVTTGSQFMQFGHGKLSCPGRFFAVQEIKLMMAYMLLNYDIKYLPSKPAAKWLGTFALPNTSATITVRRKQGTAKA